MFAIIDNNNIIRCIASERCNLWARKAWCDGTEAPCRMDDLEDRLDEYDVRIVDIETFPNIGDEFIEDGSIIAHPENYPKPSQAEIDEAKIQAEMQTLLREQAIQRLKDKGDL